MIYKLTSSKSVIAKVYRDFKPTIPGWEASAFEWIGEAIESIGQSATLEKKSTGDENCNNPINIVNYRAKLPCELVNLIAVEYNGRKLPYGGDITGYSAPTNTRTTQIYSDRINQNIDQEIIPGVSNSVAIVAASSRVIPPEDPQGDRYFINPNYIITSFESGFIKIYYEAYPVCSDGFPMIPDHYYFTTAITWYIMSKLMLLGYTNPVIDFKDAEQRWFDYKQLAADKAGFPSIDKMERFKNMWVRLIPSQTLSDDFFAGGESQERIKYI